MLYVVVESLMFLLWELDWYCKNNKMVNVVFFYLSKCTRRENGETRDFLFQRGYKMKSSNKRFKYASQLDIIYEWKRNEKCSNTRVESILKRKIKWCISMYETRAKVKCKSIFKSLFAHTLHFLLLLLLLQKVGEVVTPKR